jgi:hypothetical protein
MAAVMTILALLAQRLVAWHLRLRIRWCDEDAAWFDKLAGTEPVKAAAEAANARRNAQALRVRLAVLEGGF